MAAPSPPRCFAAWRVEAPFFRGFPFRWVLHIVSFFYMIQLRKVLCEMR